MDIHSVTHLLLSISLFSFIVSYSISYSCLIHSFKLYLSTLYSQILSKNCIFLIFNGILVFLVKTSGFMRFSREKSEPNEPPLNLFPEKEVENMRVKDENQDLNSILEVKEVDVELEDEAKEEEKRYVYDVHDAEDCELNLVTLDKEEEEQDECDQEDDDDKLSSEDLNKKFDDFIRRMKEDFRTGAQEDFRIGAQQQLVMAY